MSLLRDLENYAENLVVADLPADVRRVVGALVHVIERETGLKVPEPPPVPTGTPVMPDARDAEIARLRQALESAEAESKPAAPEAPTPPPSQSFPSPPAEAPQPLHAGTEAAPAAPSEGASS